MKWAFAPLLLTITVLLAGFLTASSFASFNYYIKAEYENYKPIPINIEITLTATVYSVATGAPAVGIPVNIKPQWSTPLVKYSDSNGKIVFTVKPLSKGNFSITYSSNEGYFATLETWITALPAVMIEAEYDKIQYQDPIGGEDIILYLTAKSSEDFTLISNPIWTVNVQASTTTVPSINYNIQSTAEKYKLAIAVNPRNSGTVGTYTISVQASSKDLLPILYKFDVLLRGPAIFFKYKFATGEEVTLAPHESGKGVDVTKGCKEFSISFYDSRGHPLIVSFIYGSKMYEIIGQAGGHYTIQNNDFTYKWFTNGVESEFSGDTLKIYFELSETYYHLIPYVQASVGGQIVSSQTELIIATVKSGFNILDFITNPFIVIPLLIILVLLLKSLFKKRGVEK